MDPQRGVVEHPKVPASPAEHGELPAGRPVGVLAVLTLSSWALRLLMGPVSFLAVEARPVEGHSRPGDQQRWSPGRLARLAPAQGRHLGRGRLQSPLRECPANLAALRAVALVFVGRSGQETLPDVIRWVSYEACTRPLDVIGPGDQYEHPLSPRMEQPWQSPGPGAHSSVSPIVRSRATSISSARSRKAV